MLLASIVTAVATACLAWVAWRQIREHRRARESARRVADARLSANAFEVRKALGALIVESHHTGWTVNWIGALVNLHAPPLRDRLERALVDAAGASPETAARVAAAFVQYQRGIAAFEVYAREYERQQQANANPLSDAREHLRRCCRELELVVQPELLAEAKRLRALPEI